MDQNNFIANLPKVELHVHLEGTVTPEFWLNLVKARRLCERFASEQNSFRTAKGGMIKNIFLQLNSIRKYYGKQFPRSPFIWPYSLQHLTQRYNFQFFSDFLDTYGDILRSFNTEEDLKDLVKNHLLRAAEQNIRYCEVMFTPWFFEKMGFNFFEMMDAIDEGAKWVEERKNIKMKMIFDGPRNFGQEVVKEVFQAALKDRTNRVIGVGLGGDEKNFPARWFKNEFDFARANGLKMIAHAGEIDGEKSMLDAIEILNVSRLGHGLNISKNSRLDHLVRERGITIDACPNSNIATGVLSKIEDHPIKKYLDRGYQVTLNSDDPALFKTSLNKEFQTIEKVFGLKTAEIAQLSINAVDGSFLPLEERSALKKEIQKSVDGAK